LEEEDIFPDTSRDEEIVRKLFGERNCGFLRPSGDGNMIILSDSDEEEKVHEDDCADAEAAPSFAGNSPAPTAFAADTVDAPNGAPDGSNGGSTPDRVQDDSSDGGDEVGMH
jgi:hypothetical protein